MLENTNCICTFYTIKQCTAMPAGRENEGLPDILSKVLALVTIFKYLHTFFYIADFHEYSTMAC